MALVDDRSEGCIRVPRMRLATRHLRAVWYQPLRRHRSAHSRHRCVRLASVQFHPGASLARCLGHAALEGRINDPSGAMVAGAHITAKEKSTGLARESESNSEGLFRIAALRVLRIAGVREL